jgi:hypothetical protein
LASDLFACSSCVPERFSAACSAPFAGCADCCSSEASLFEAGFAAGFFAFFRTTTTFFFSDFFSPPARCSEDSDDFAASVLLLSAGFLCFIRVAFGFSGFFS